MNTLPLNEPAGVLVKTTGAKLPGERSDRHSSYGLPDQ